MDKIDPGQERAVTDKALSYSFAVDPNAERVINAKIPLLAKDMVIKPESMEVSGTETKFVPDSIHITFNDNIPRAQFGYALRGAFTTEIDGTKLILTVKDNRISKDMVKDVLSLLHEYGAISTHGTDEAAKKFGVECPIDIKLQPGATFRERSFPHVDKGSIKNVIKSRGSPEDPSPKGMHR